jgi:hypothetical protein
MGIGPGLIRLTSIPLTIGQSGQTGWKCFPAPLPLCPPVKFSRGRQLQAVSRTALRGAAWPTSRLGGQNAADAFSSKARTEFHYCDRSLGGKIL